MDKITKKQFITGSIWKITESIAAKGVSFIVSLLLARILAPSDYGIIAITAIFTNLSDVLIDGGFSTTLIRKKDVDKIDYNCVLVASFGIATVLYTVLFLSAPMIANYYNEKLLCPILRVIGLVLFIQAFSATRNAIIHREMRFKLLFYCNMIGSVVSGLVGIVAAVVGLGVWALVIQQLLQQIIVTILLFSKLHWEFELNFEAERFKEIFRFSIGVMGASLLNYIGSSLYNLVIGKKYSVTDLGYSDKGGQLPMQVSLYTFSAMSSVLLPTLSSYQDEMQVFKKILRKTVSMTAYIIFPLMIGMAVISDDIIVVLLTEKWLPCVKIMQYSCLYYIVTPFMLINVQVFYALGHGFLRVKTELIRIALLVIGLVIFVLEFKCSISQIALVNAIIAVIMMIVTFYEVKKIVTYNIKEVIDDVFKPCICSIIMGILVYNSNCFLKYLNVQSSLIRLIVCIVVGIVVYVIQSAVCKLDGYVEIMLMLKSRRAQNE